MQNVFQLEVKKELLQVNCGHTEPCIILILILIFPGNFNSFAQDRLAFRAIISCMLLIFKFLFTVPQFAKETYIQNPPPQVCKIVLKASEQK